MDKLIDGLEDWRASRGMSKASMARLIGAASSQVYTNWVNRDSLPKEYYAIAMAILETDSIRDAMKAARVAELKTERALKAKRPETGDISEMLDKLAEDAKLEAFAAICRQLSPQDALRLARLLLDRAQDEI